MKVDVGEAELIIVHLRFDFAGMGFYIIRVDVSGFSPSLAKPFRGEGSSMFDPARDAIEKGEGGWGRALGARARSWLCIGSG